MKKKDFRWLWAIVIVFAVIAVFLFVTKPKNNENSIKPTTLDKSDEMIQKCTGSNGKWINFDNSCVDSCYKQRHPEVTCVNKGFSGCDCGKDKCWNDQTYLCEVN